MINVEHIIVLMKSVMEIKISYWMVQISKGSIPFQYFGNIVSQLNNMSKYVEGDINNGRCKTR